MSAEKKTPLRKMATAATAAAISLTAFSSAGMAMAEDATDNANDPTASETTRADTTYTASIEGTDVTFTKNADGAYTADVALKNVKFPETVVATGSDGTTVTLDSGDISTDSVKTDADKVGIVTATYSTTYTGTSTDGTKFTVNATMTDSTDTVVSVNNGSGFTHDADRDVYVAKMNTIALHGTTPATNTVFLNNNMILSITWGDLKIDTSDGLMYYKEGVAKETITAKTPAYGATGSWNVEVDARAENTREYTATIDGVDMPMTTGEDGTQTLNVENPLDKQPGTITVTDNDGTSYNLDPVDSDNATTPTDTLGVYDVTGTATYHRDKDGTVPAIDITVPYQYQTGEEITLDNGISFTKGDDGAYHAQTSHFTLSDANKPDGDTITLSDGTTVPVTWDAKPTVIDKATADGGTAKYVRLAGTATGTITEGDTTVTFTVDATADRAQDASFTALTVMQTNPATKETTPITINGFSPDTTSYTITLPHSATGYSYTLSPTVGVDATETVGVTKLNGSSRVLTVTVNGTEYTVTVSFDASDIKADSPAKLKGIYVDYSGQDVQGDLIDNWDPNRLDYTIALPDASLSPYILPVPEDGVTVSAGDVTQSAQSTKQVWHVTDDASGASRDYSVTVTRPVETAVTRFSPDAPVAQTPVVDADSDDDANLASVGYVTADGTYTPVNKDSFTIPEGATFSYEPKIGQTAAVSYTRNGMAYDYTVNVLAPDGKTFGQHEYSVTYITTATHKSTLNGIVVNGQNVPGFSPDKHDYDVYVDNIDQWTVVADYDKDSGMSVSISKDGATATITVTSADGLSVTTYTVHAKQTLFKGAGSVGVGEHSGQLADTGASVTLIGLAAMVCAALAGGLAFLRGKLGEAGGRHASGK